MGVDDLHSLRAVFRSFKRSASKLRKCEESLASCDLEFGMSWQQGGGLQASFDESSPLVRFAALLRPFMSRDSVLELRSVWDLLLENELPDPATHERVDQQFSDAEDLGIAVVVNEHRVTAHNVYYAYAEGCMFADDPEAKHLLEQLSVGPMREMLRYLFYSACLNYSRIVFLILDAILAAERHHPGLRAVRLANPRCIYCLTRDGDFGPEEHVIPEAFGLDELVLSDAVCWACNNKLSELDQFLAEFEPLSLLRVWHVPLTKRGKFPRAEFRDFSIERLKPRELRITSKSNPKSVSMKNLPDGTVRWSLKAVGRKKSDVSTLGRSLFKIGLGLVAHDKGPDYACDARFDAARNFIFGRDAMPNHLWMSKKAQPTGRISTLWQSVDDKTIVVLDFYGVCFAFNLEPTDIALPADAPTDLVQAYWLGTDSAPE